MRIMLTPTEILAKMESLTADYETARQILDAHQPMFEAHHDDCLVNIQARQFDEFTNPVVREALENAVISKLTIDEKNALIAAENPKLADRVKRAQGVLKRITAQFEMFNSLLIYQMHNNKQERNLNNYRT